MSLMSSGRMYLSYSFRNKVHDLAVFVPKLQSRPHAKKLPESCQLNQIEAPSRSILPNSDKIGHGQDQ